MLLGKVVGNGWWGRKGNGEEGKWWVVYGHFSDFRLQGKMKLATNAQFVQFYRYGNFELYQFSVFLLLCSFCFKTFLFFKNFIYSILISFTHPRAKFAFCFWDKAQTKTNLGVGRIYFSFKCIVHHWGSQVRCSKETAWGMLLTGLLPLCSSVCLFVQPRTTCIGVALPEWVINHHSSGICPTDTLRGQS